MDWPVRFALAGYFFLGEGCIRHKRAFQKIGGLVTEPAEPRRLPAPWHVVEHSESFVVEDANGRPLAYVYFEDEPVRRSLMNRLTSDEAWLEHRKIARLVEEGLSATRSGHCALSMSALCH